MELCNTRAKVPGLVSGSMEGMKMEEMTLKRCPFCGSNAYPAVFVIQGKAIDYIAFRIKCSECGAGKEVIVQSGCDYGKFAEAIMNTALEWNRRVNEDG